ncbi:hypothetical protein M059_09185 [Streptococcus mitis 18/56]|uniref:Uncharacterized protein n=1 Tax=Streptococcus mitis 18/56 TaxID=1340485 RepID=S7YY57_STRMT|nr:hypothetical protein M059_09185 [Streptococcus mitis 18/56]
MPFIKKMLKSEALLRKYGELMEDEKEMLFRKLQAEINQSILDIEQGIYFTREDLAKRYGL